MHEKTSVKSENSKTTSKRPETTPKQAIHKRESSSCGSCGVCSSLRSPRVTSEGISTVMSQAKALGKESCAVSFMQRNYGNRFTANILAPTIQKKCSCGGSCSRCKGEEEADKVSMSIMKMESPAISHKPYAISYMPSAINQRDEQAQISEIMASKGSGHSLDDNSRSFMEQRFGYDFNHVRIHTDSYAARKSNELNAEAFIIGKDIFFNTGRHNPSSSDGKKLLAHELTHVVQQSQQNGNAFFRFKKDSEKYINKIDVNLSSTTDVPWLVWQIGGEKLKEKFSGLKERDDFKYSEGDATASYNDGTQETFDVSGGAIKCCGTPAGSNFSIHRKEGKDYVSGKGDPMPHASYFHKGYAFHGCGQVYGISPDWYCLSYPSHGCIHVKNSKMEQLNPFIKIRKTKVKINV